MEGALPGRELASGRGVARFHLDSIFSSPSLSILNRLNPHKFRNTERNVLHKLMGAFGQWMLQLEECQWEDASSKHKVMVLHTCLAVEMGQSCWDGGETG